MSESAYIVVVQQYDSITKMIRKFLGDTPNRIDYFGSPSDALETILKNIATSGFPDVVITGEKFYIRNFDRKPEAEPEVERSLEFFAGGSMESIPLKYRKPEKNPATGGEFAMAVHEIKPAALVLRYSVDAEEDQLKYGINGDVPKEGSLDPILGLLRDGELKRVVQEKRWDEMKARHPHIKFYDNMPE